MPTITKKFTPEIDASLYEELVAVAKHVEGADVCSGDSVAQHSCRRCREKGCSGRSPSFDIAEASNGELPVVGEEDARLGQVAHDGITRGPTGQRDVDRSPGK